MNLQEKLARLQQILLSLERPVVDALLPGIGLGGVTSAYAGAPGDAKIWFAWSSGVASAPEQTVDDSSVIPGYYPLSLEEARSYVRAWGSESIAILGGEQYLPFLGAPNGDCYAFVWSSDDYVGVVGLIVGEEAEVEFAGLEAMLDYVLACYEEGAFYVDTSGHLAMDPARCDEILARLQESGR